MMCLFSKLRISVFIYSLYLLHYIDYTQHHIKNIQTSGRNIFQRVLSNSILLYSMNRLPNRRANDAR